MTRQHLQYFTWAVPRWGHLVSAKVRLNGEGSVRKDKNEDNTIKTNDKNKKIDKDFNSENFNFLDSLD